jgi:hypothetical protein
MNRRSHPPLVPGLLVFALLTQLLPIPLTSAQTAAAAVPVLTINGAVGKPLELSAGDLKGLPRKMVTVVNPHDKKTETYEGVRLQTLLLNAGAPQGHDLRGAAMAAYLLAEGSDGYRVLFSLAELDADFSDAQVLVADTLDGAPLGANVGPLRLVVPQDKRPARWVRMLRTLTVVQVAK